MDQVKIGKFIAELRKAAGLTQEQLGEKMGVTNKTVSRWETGSYMPGIDTMLELSKFFGINLNELLCGERLTDEEFRKQSDENVAAICREARFSVREQEHFWKRKWLKEHAALIALSGLLLLGALCWLFFSGRGLLIPVWALAAIIVYAWLRNKMMIYIEEKLYS